MIKDPCVSRIFPRRPTSIVSGLALCLSLSGFATAAPITWQGATGTGASGVWNTPTHWSGGVLPQAVDSAIFGGPGGAVDLTSNPPAINSLDFGSGAGAYTFGGAGSLTLTAPINQRARINNQSSSVQTLGSVTLGQESVFTTSLTGNVTRFNGSLAANGQILTIAGAGTTEFVGLAQTGTLNFLFVKNSGGGTANLRLSSGSVVTHTGGLLVGDGIADGVVAGSVVVTGSGTQLLNTNSGGTSRIGRLGGNGSLTIQQGALYRSVAQMTIGTGSGASGSVTVTGAGTRFESGTITVGGNGSPGTFTLADGATAQVQSFVGDGTVSVAEGTELAMVTPGQAFAGFSGTFTGAGTIAIAGNIGYGIVQAQPGFTGDFIITSLARVNFQNENSLQNARVELLTTTDGITYTNGVTQATIGSLSGTGNLSLPGPLTAGGNNASTTYSGRFIGGTLIKAGTGNMTLSGGTGPLPSDLNRLEVSAGTVTLAGFLRSTEYSVGNGATLDLNNQTLVVSGSGGLLQNNGTVISPLSTVQVTNGARLTGTGTFVPQISLLIQNEATLAPGTNAPGTLTGGSTTFDAGGRYEWQINDANGVTGVNYDLLNVTGTLSTVGTAGNPFRIVIGSLTAANAPGSLLNWNPNANYTWTLVETSGGIIGFDPLKFFVDTTNFTAANPSNGAFTLAQRNNALVLNYATAAVVVPESGTGLLALVALIPVAIVSVRRGRFVKSAVSA